MLSPVAETFPPLPSDALALGVDNLLISEDWPFEPNVMAVEFLRVSH